jgi:hypothetical protein
MPIRFHCHFLLRYPLTNHWHRPLLTPARPRLRITKFLTSHTTEMQTNMPDGSTPSMKMVPWLHFTGGDHLLFKSWQPTSSGAIAGACIGLALLAIFDRWIAASRSVLESHWRQRCGLYRCNLFSDQTV